MSGWMDLLAAYMSYQAADKASKPGKISNTITPQQQWLFDKLKGLIDYSPTRDYVSSYADSYLKGMNAPGGSLNWKPTFKSDYMKDQQPLPNMSVDLSKLPIFQGDKTGKMPWNAGYTGPGIGGKAGGTASGFNAGNLTGPRGNAIGGGAGRRPGGLMQDVGPETGDWSPDYYNNAFNTGGNIHTQPPDPYSNPNGPRDEYGLLIDSMNNTNFTDIVRPNQDGTVSLHFPGMPQPSTLSQQQWAQLQANEGKFKQWFAANAQKVYAYAREHKVDILKAALMLFGI